MRIAYKNFTGGEIAPTLSARYDMDRYATSAQCMQNMLPGLHGDASRRPGTHFLADLGAYSVLIPFSFNVEVGQNFVLVLSDKTLRVADGRGALSAPVQTPYAAEDLLRISYAQVGDIVYLAHPAYPLHKIMRKNAPAEPVPPESPNTPDAPGVASGDYLWNIGRVILNESIAAPGTPSVSFNGSGGSFTLRYKVVAVDADGRESLPSPTGTGGGARHPSDWVQGNSASISWQAVPGAVEYNIYREEAGYFGFIGVKDAAEASGGVVNSVRVGQITGSLGKFVGSITRVVVNSGGKPGITPTDTTSPLTVTPSGSQNAFSFDAKLLVYVTKTTTTTTWRSNGYDDNGNPLWASSTTSSSEYFWAMVSPSSSTVPAGTYASYVTGSLGSASDAPSGVISVYTVVPVYSGAATLGFTDNNYEADTSDTPKEDWDPFADGNNPGIVAFHQQRMVLAATPKSPQAFYMSRTGDFENFRKSRPLQDDDPVEYLIASGSIDAVTWAAGFGDLLLGTSGSEYKAAGDGGVITSKNISITAQSYWGSAGLIPLIIGNSVLHVQRHGSRVRDLFYSLEKDGYAGNDLSIMAPHLFDGHVLLQWAYQQTPGSHVWCVRDDGALLVLTYLKEHKISGWSRQITDGRVLSAASISGSGGDVILLSVERVINGRKRVYLERLADPFAPDTDISEAYFVDCGITVRHAEPSTKVTGLEHLEGRTPAVLADGSPVEGLTVQGGRLELPYPARIVHIGLPYSSVLSPLPVEADTQNGSTLGKRRAYGRCSARVFRSVGGKYGPSQEELNDFPFMPASYGAPCEPFSGDLEFTPGGGQDADTSVYLVQDTPLPWQVTAVTCDVDFGEV